MHADTLTQIVYHMIVVSLLCNMHIIVLLKDWRIAVAKQTCSCCSIHWFEFHERLFARLVYIWALFRDWLRDTTVTCRPIHEVKFIACNISNKHQTSYIRPYIKVHIVGTADYWQQTFEQSSMNAPYCCVVCHLYRPRINGLILACSFCGHSTVFLTHVTQHTGKNEKYRVHNWATSIRLHRQFYIYQKHTCCL
jgi:hypothetical protein